MASMAAFVYFWSSAYEVSGGCATETLYPSFLRMLATASQPEPSANAPCTRTTFLITPSRFDSILPPLILCVSFFDRTEPTQTCPRWPWVLARGKFNAVRPADCKQVVLDAPFSAVQRTANEAPVCKL